MHMKVKFLPMDVEHEVKPGQSILDLAQQNNLHIQSVCKGIPSCAECRVYLKEGETNVIPPSDQELDLIGTAYFVDQRRLSCQLKCFGDVTVDLTEQLEKQENHRDKIIDNNQRFKENSHARLGNILDEQE